MNTNPSTNQRLHPEAPPYALRRAADSWEVTFQGRQSAFSHELGAHYVAYLLSEPPRNPIHGVALALKAREKLGQPPGPAEALQQRVIGLEDAESARAMCRRQRDLERVLADRLEIEPVKAEALMVLPTLVVGNELLILGVVGLTVGGLRGRGRSAARRRWRCRGTSSRFPQPPNA